MNILDHNNILKQDFSVFQSEETHLPPVSVNNIKLFQENVCHMFLPITNVWFVAFKNASEGSLSKAFLLCRKHTGRNNILYINSINLRDVSYYFDSGIKQVVKVVIV